MADTLEQRLERLEGAEAIRNLIAAYGPLADSGDAGGVAALWIEDGTYEVGGFGTAQGRDEIASLLRSDTHSDLMRQGCAHILSEPHIVLDADRAIATNHSVVFRRDGGMFEPWRVSANRWELVRSGTAWLIERRVNAPLTGDQAARGLLGMVYAKEPIS